MPNIGYAKRSGTTRIHQPGRYLPIILIPGICGSRLVDDKGKLVWNPTGSPIGDSPGEFKVDVKALESPSELFPDEDHGYEEEEKREEVKHIKHFNNLVTDFYKDMAIRLSEMSDGEFTDYRVRPKVYCCGYDWRQDNAKSALRLADVIEEALRDTRERKVIIVAHSMGGLIARYYCRILGGESKVHQLFLIGSPTLGAPSAYVQLKQGVGGLYVKDMVENAVSGNLLGVVTEAADMTGRALMMASTIAAGATSAGILGFLGDLYVAASLSLGRFMTREESITFARSITSLYQLLPNAAFCSQHKNWVIFDPLATGHKPVGFMVVFPTLLDGVVELVAAAASSGEQVKSDVDKFLERGTDERTSPLATRNMVTLAELLEKAIKGISDMTTGLEQAIGGEEGPHDDPWKAMGDAGKDLGKVFKHLGDQVKRTFVDCASNKQLYNDIYTGLLDIIEHRALCAGKLALAYRFDEALTVKKPPKLTMTALDLIAEVLKPILNAYAAIGMMFVKVFDTGNFETALNQSAREIREADEREAERRARKPKVYMHPRTVNIFSESFQVESGCLLLPTAIHSNYDSNEVVSQVLPNLVAMIVGMAAGASFEPAWFGDGTVPSVSANPEAAMLSHDFLNAGGEKVNATHAAMTNEASVMDYVERRMQGLLMSYLS